MKLPCALPLLLAAAPLAAGRSLARAGKPEWPEPTAPDPMDAVLARLSGREQGSGPGSASTLPADGPSGDLSVSDLLGSARWPTEASRDEVFATALSGAAATPCSAPLLGRARLSPYGFGAHVNHFANEVALAMYSGKPIALCAPPEVRDTWARYFQDPGFARCASCDWDTGPRRYREMGFDVSNGHDHEQVADIKRYLYHKLFALQADTQMLVDEGLRTMGLAGSTYVGVHIRRGDKAQEVAPVPIEKYAAAVATFCSEVGASTVFLASDDDQARGALQEQLGSSLAVVEQARLPAADYSFRGRASRAVSPGYGVEDEEKAVLIDVTALARAAAFVGTASSNIDRWVYFLRDGSAPAVSLDEGGTEGFITLQSEQL